LHKTDFISFFNTFFITFANVVFIPKNMKKDFPVLTTERLILSRPVEGDMQHIIHYLDSDKVYSENTANMPYPYKEADAEFLIHEVVDKGFENKTDFVFAIRNKENGLIMGLIGIHHWDKANQKAEIGYWLGKEFWNKGYVTEAMAEVLAFGFEVLNLNKMFANFFPHNPASGRVMEKSGMKQEAVLRQEIYKNGKFLDFVRYSILKEDFKK
jgi:acetyltransferase, GNAT family